MSRPSVEPSQTAQGDTDAGTRIEALREEWVNAVLAFDEQAADAVLTTAFGLFAPETVCIDLIQKALATIGDGWYEGRVTVQQEHFASALAMRKLESLLSTTPPPTRPGRILVGCPPEESHTFVPLMLSLLLRRKGWNVIYLGADIPVQSLEVTINTTRPDLVLLSSQQLHTVVGLMEMANVLAESQIPLGYGGLIFNRFPSLLRILPGYFLGNQLHQAIQAVEQIMIAPRPKRADEVVGQQHLIALEQYQDKRALIEAEVWKQLADADMPQRHLNAGNANFGRSIQAALALGNMDFLGPDMAWIQGLLHNHYRMPRFMVKEYLHAYRYAVERFLGTKGEVILAWLDHVLAHQTDSKSPLAAHSSQSASPGHGKRTDREARDDIDGYANGRNGNSNGTNGSHSSDDTRQSPAAFHRFSDFNSTRYQRN
jgi:methanogenic corrinoid protein MtbC1